MAQGYTYYDGLTRWFIRDEIGLGLRERYEVQELPPKLLTLVRKLGAAEGNYLSRYAPLAEPRVGPSDDDDWPLCT
jgi:hypothetical protein